MSVTPPCADDVRHDGRAVEVTKTLDEQALHALVQLRAGLTDALHGLEQRRAVLAHGASFVVHHGGEAGEDLVIVALELVFARQISNLPDGVHALRRILALFQHETVVATGLLSALTTGHQSQQAEGDGQRQRDATLGHRFGPRDGPLN